MINSILLYCYLTHTNILCLYIIRLVVLMEIVKNLHVILLTQGDKLKSKYFILFNIDYFLF